METNNKRYGLLIPKKRPFVSATTTEFVQKPSVFGEDSSNEDDEVSNIDWVKKSLQGKTYGEFKNRQARADIEKVLKEDPTAYQYDELYDQIKEKESEIVAVKRKERKPIYTPLLIAQAEKRKQENERRIQKQIHKDREAEGNEFEDKEIFVTSSYKKHLEESRIVEEKLTEQDMVDEKEREQERLKPIWEKRSIADIEKEKKENEIGIVKEEERESRDAQVKSCNRKNEREGEGNKLQNKEIFTASSQKKESEDVKSLNEEESEQNTEKIAEEKSKEKESIPKQSVWLKRTVGEVYEIALRRYFERKANNLPSQES